MNKWIGLGVLVGLIATAGASTATAATAEEAGQSYSGTSLSGLSLLDGRARVGAEIGNWAVRGLGGRYSANGDYRPLDLRADAPRDNAGWAAGLGVAHRFQVTQGQDFWLYGEATRHEWWQASSAGLTSDPTSHWWQTAVGVKLPLAGDRDRSDWLVDVAYLHVLEPDYQAGGPKSFGARPLGADNGLRLRLERNWRFSHAGSLAVGFFGEQWGFRGIDASSLTGSGGGAYLNDGASQSNTAWGADVKYRLRF